MPQPLLVFSGIALGCDLADDKCFFCLIQLLKFIPSYKLTQQSPQFLFHSTRVVMFNSHFLDLDWLAKVIFYN